MGVATHAGNMAGTHYLHQSASMGREVALKPSKSSEELWSVHLTIQNTTPDGRLCVCVCMCVCV